MTKEPKVTLLVVELGFFFFFFFFGGGYKDFGLKRENHAKILKKN